MKKGLSRNGTFVIVGSSFSSPGSHGWRYPLYSISKGALIILTKILAQELAINEIKVVGVSFDVLDGGMNGSMSAMAKQLNADRTLSGEIPSMREAAAQIEWILGNPNRLLSGSFVDLTGGAQP
jgi:NAD(P)-dependent dehydrogenase (short-subunit alcohol dehydrogenase family)